MKPEEIKTIAVLGAGIMGHGIAEVAALHGYDIKLMDIKEEILKGAMDKVRWSLDKLVSKGKFTKDQADSAIGRIKTFVGLKESVEGADLIIEVVPEDIELKKKVFKECIEHCPKHTILASNTSGLSITEMAEVTDRPERFIGMHWFNPPPLMDLIEIVKGEKTSDETVELLKAVSKSMGKTPIIVKRDVPWFVVNTLLMTFTGEASSIVSRGEATEKQMNASMVFQYGFPMGPSELSQLIFMGIRAPRDYTEEDRKGFDIMSTTFIFHVINVAADLINRDVISVEDLDTGMRLGTNWPKGPLEWADEIGIEEIVKRLEEAKEKYKDAKYEPNQLLKKMVEEGKTGKKAGEGFYKY